MICSEAVQAAGKWIGRVKNLCKCFLATRYFSVLKAVIPSQLLLKVAHYICGDVSRQKSFSKRRIFRTDQMKNHWGEKNKQTKNKKKNNYYAPHACSIFINSLKANVSLKQERIKICVQSCCITYPWDWSAADEKALQDSSLNRHEIISPSDWD